MPVGIPLEGMTAMIEQLRQLAKDAGRDPLSLEVIVSATISIAPQRSAPIGRSLPVRSIR
jgi:alkanesulfonate monooxygenase SsuD/methylene tetrahydromethanopterin reductase-like flavin-dependent oxidoreductase (luciferase family)